MVKVWEPRDSVISKPCYNEMCYKGAVLYLVDHGLWPDQIKVNNKFTLFIHRLYIIFSLTKHKNNDKMMI